MVIGDRSQETRCASEIYSSTLIQVLRNLDKDLLGEIKNCRFRYIGGYDWEGRGKGMSGGRFERRYGNLYRIEGG